MKINKIAESQVEWHGTRHGNYDHAYTLGEAGNRALCGNVRDQNTFPSLSDLPCTGERCVKCSRALDRLADTARS